MQSNPMQLKSLVTFAFACLTTLTLAESRPNILVIVADDLGWGGVGFHAKGMTTPHLDRLAKEGAELGRFYAHPVCSPTRAALLTGQNPRRLGIVGALHGNDPGVPAGLPMLPSTLRAAGYRTSLIGKWHVGRSNTPQQAGFEKFYGFLNAEIDYYTHTGQRGAADWQRDGKPLKEEGYSTYLMADDAVRQLKSRDRTKPFYLQVNFNAPHDPLAAPPEVLARHKAEGEKIGLYNAVVEAMDIGIGRILDAIDAEGLRESTLVLFISDNGGATRLGGSNLPLRGGKDTVWEGGIRTPAVARWPRRITPGIVINQPISAQDLYPTLAAAAGATLPAEAKIDGTNQLPQLLSGKASPREAILIASYDIALIDGDWKLIESQDGGSRQLYNLKDDPSERSNLAKTNPETLAKLGAKLDALKKGLPEAPAQARRPGAAGGGRGAGRPSAR